MGFDVPQLSSLFSQQKFVFGVLSDPDTIRRGLDALIQRETEEVREDSTLLAETLSEKLSQNARTRRAYQDQQAAGLMTLEELAARLEELEHARRALEAELAALERTHQKAEELKEDREAALASLAASIPEALDNLTGEEINKVPASFGFGSSPPTRATTPPGYFVLWDLHLQAEEVCEG